MNSNSPNTSQSSLDNYTLTPDGNQLTNNLSAIAEGNRTLHSSDFGMKLPLSRAKDSSGGESGESMSSSHLTTPEVQNFEPGSPSDVDLSDPSGISLDVDFEKELGLEKRNHSIGKKIGDQKNDPTRKNGDPYIGTPLGRAEGTLRGDSEFSSLYFKDEPSLDGPRGYHRRFPSRSRGKNIDCQKHGREKFSSKNDRLSVPLSPDGPHKGGTNISRIEGKELDLTPNRRVSFRENLEDVKLLNPDVIKGLRPVDSDEVFDESDEADSGLLPHSHMFKNSSSVRGRPNNTNTGNMVVKGRNPEVEMGGTDLPNRKFSEDDSNLFPKWTKLQQNAMARELSDRNSQPLEELNKGTEVHVINIENESVELDNPIWGWIDMKAPNGQLVLADSFFGPVVPYHSRRKGSRGGDDMPMEEEDENLSLDALNWKRQYEILATQYDQMKIVWTRDNAKLNFSLD